MTTSATVIDSNVLQNNALMKKNGLTLKDYTRAGHVTRWHSVRTMRKETLAEHHYMVAILSRELAERIVGETLSDHDRLLLQDYALHHDDAELLLGDLPTPVKRKLAALTGDGNPIKQLEREICPRTAQLENAIKTTPLGVICKLADILAAISFITVEGINEHAQTIEHKALKFFHKKVEEGISAYPDLQWQTAHDVLNEVLHGTDTHIEWE